MQLDFKIGRSGNDSGNAFAGVLVATVCFEPDSGCQHGSCLITGLIASCSNELLVSWRCYSVSLTRLPHGTLSLVRVKYGGDTLQILLSLFFIWTFEQSKVSNSYSLSVTLSCYSFSATRSTVISLIRSARFRRSIHESSKLRFIGCDSHNGNRGNEERSAKRQMHFAESKPGRSWPESSRSKHSIVDCR